MKKWENKMQNGWNRNDTKRKMRIRENRRLNENYYVYIEKKIDYKEELLELRLSTLSPLDWLQWWIEYFDCRGDGTIHLLRIFIAKIHLGLS